MIEGPEGTKSPADPEMLLTEGRVRVFEPDRTRAVSWPNEGGMRKRYRDSNAE